MNNFIKKYVFDIDIGKIQEIFDSEFTEELIEKLKSIVDEEDKKDIVELAKKIAKEYIKLYKANEQADIDRIHKIIENYKSQLIYFSTRLKLNLFDIIYELCQEIIKRLLKEFLNITVL